METKEANIQEYQAEYKQLQINCQFSKDYYSFDVFFRKDILCKYSSNDDSPNSYLDKIISPLLPDDQVQYVKELGEVFRAYIEHISLHQDDLREQTKGYSIVLSASITKIYYFLLFSFMPKSDPPTSTSNNQLITYPDLLRFNILNLAQEYPGFLLDYYILLDKGYIVVKDDGFLIWNKSKQSLAEYFDYIKPNPDKNMDWSLIERIFGEKLLANSLSRNGNADKTKKSKDFLDWLEIKKNTTKPKQNT